MAYMSQEGYDKLVAELKQLTTVERPKASAAIADCNKLTRSNFSPLRIFKASRIKSIP